GYAHHGQNAGDHADVHKHVHEEHHGHGATQQAAVLRVRLLRNVQAARHQQTVKHQHHDAAIQPEFFSEHRKDEIGGALGNEVEVCLGTHHVPLAVNAPRTDGNHRLYG